MQERCAASLIMIQWLRLQTACIEGSLACCPALLDPMEFVRQPLTISCSKIICFSSRLIPSRVYVGEEVGCGIVVSLCGTRLRLTLTVPNCNCAID